MKFDLFMGSTNYTQYSKITNEYKNSVLLRIVEWNLCRMIGQDNVMAYNK